ncbi:ABC transporter permease [Paenibacillus pasadenensis]|uniref:YhgE/Pip domain-containing protein n=1 Tax=Paenibacillus pasadenensis TaxID=217090 RepID=UPI0020407948|nr:ABC transporter permease [Paenibacillus pasadenensis]
MSQAIIMFLKRPTTIAGFAVALMMQIIFSVLWMTGYDGVGGRASELGIAVVSDDRQAGDAAAEQITSTLPFQMSRVKTLDDAKNMLDERKVHLVVYFPADFTAKAAAAKEGTAIQYWINESNPMNIKSIMSGVIQQITQSVNSQTTATGISAVLEGQGMDKTAAAAAAGQLSVRVHAETNSMHAVPNLKDQMVPMMIVLSSWVGAMIMAQNFNTSSMAMGASVGKWKKFGAQLIVTIGAGVVISLLSATLLSLLGDKMESGFLAFWLFELLMLVTFMLTAQMFIYLLGTTGMFLNVLFMSLQLVSSGTTVPRELLPTFFHDIGAFLPATYSVQGIMNLLFGGPSAGQDILILALMAAAALIISIASVGLKKSRTVPNAVAANAVQR